MKKKVLVGFMTSMMLFSFQDNNFAQAPVLGTAASFVLFTSNGAVSNTATSHLTGNIGSNAGSSTAFGNVDGVMHDNDGTSAKASADLLLAYNQLDASIATLFPASLLGNGQILYPGIYSIASEATLNLDLTLDAKGNANAVFIFKIEGAFSTGASSRIILVNGAKACNVYWKIEGLVSMAAGTVMRGTIVANNAAINMLSGSTLEGRALSTNGAITISGALASVPVGCGSPVLTGPSAPELGTAACYGLFSSDGDVSNSGISRVSGDVGSNKGGATGFDPLMVSGKIHALPDASTRQCASDLSIAYEYINLLAPDIELLYPAQFGNSLVLTPHTYVMKGAAALTDTVILNAQNNPDAVFVFQINGALTTSTYAYVKLLNGAQEKNVYWKIEGAVNISDYSVFRGTIICNNGALGALSTGVVLDGRALTTSGALSSVAITTHMSALGCNTTGVGSSEEGSTEAVSFMPNPFSTAASMVVHEKSLLHQGEFKLVDSKGTTIMQVTITKEVMALPTNNMPSGIYFYNVTNHHQVIQSGRLIAE